MINRVSFVEVSKVYPINLNESRTKFGATEPPQVSKPAEGCF